MFQATTESVETPIGHPAGEDIAPKKPFWVTCGACQHTWAAAYLPMEATLFAKVAKARCPMCAGGPKNVFIAKQKDGVLTAPSGSTQGAG